MCFCNSLFNVLIGMLGNSWCEIQNTVMVLRFGTDRSGQTWISDQGLHCLLFNCTCWTHPKISKANCSNLKIHLNLSITRFVIRVPAFGYNMDQGWTQNDSFYYISYVIFSWYNTDWISNMEIGLDPNNSVIQRMWCILEKSWKLRHLDLLL